MESRLVRSLPVRVFWVPVLAGDNVLRCCVKHFSLTVLLSIQVLKCEPANLMLRLTLQQEPIDGLLSYNGLACHLGRGSRILLSRFMLQKPG